MTKTGKTRQYHDGRVTTAQLSVAANVYPRTINRWRKIRPELVKMLELAVKAKRFIEASK